MKSSRRKNLHSKCQNLFHFLTRKSLFFKDWKKMYFFQLPNFGNRASQVEKFLNLSLSKLQLDYVDLYLIHTPFGFNYHDDNTMIPMKPDNTVDLDFSTDLQAIWKVNIT